MAPDISTSDVIRDLLLDPKDGLSARLLVVETEQTKMAAKQDAILLALSGDSQTKGLIELVRELREAAASKAERIGWWTRDFIWKGAILGALLILLDVFLRKMFGVA